MHASERTANVPLKKIEHNFHAVYYFSRVFGLWPFTIVRNSNGSIQKARVRPIDGFWFWISFCSYSIAIYSTCVSMTEMKMEKGKSFVFFLYNVYQIVYLFFGSCVIILDLLNLKRLISILKKFSKFDTEVGFLCR